MPTITHDTPDGAFRLTDFLPFRLAVVTDRVLGAFAGDFGGTCNLTIPEWRVMAIVAEHGTLSPTTVSQHTEMDKVKVSRAAQSLAAKGMMRHGPDPNDGRGRLLKLTRKGSATYTTMVGLATAREAVLFGDLSHADRRAFGRILGKLGAAAA